MELSEHDQRVLLSLARASIASALGIDAAEPDNLSAGSLQEPAGAFVTLRQAGELRGCIGYVEPRYPLAETVRQVARKAAFEDPRFRPVARTEFDTIDIEVSVLSALQRVSSTEEIEVGRHGLVIEADLARGLLLPHVATEYSWTREEFLYHTCLKAGLPSDSWKRPDVRLFTFTTQTFSEKMRGSKSHGEHS